MAKQSGVHVEFFQQFWPTICFGFHQMSRMIWKMGHCMKVLLSRTTPKKCQKHHGHKKDSVVTLGSCGANGEKTQVILVRGRAPGVINASHPRRLGFMKVPLCVAHGMRILECLRTPHLDVWARRYANLSGALSKNNALEQQWHGNGSWDYECLSMHNFLNTCPNALRSSLRCALWSTWNIDDDKVVGCENPRSYVEIMGVWNC